MKTIPASLMVPFYPIMRSICVLGTIIFLVTGCKKPAGDEPEPQATACLISKAAYSEGDYTHYKFDADGRLTGATLTAFNEAGGIIDIPVTYEYNAAGNLVKAKNTEGWVDEYTYDAGGALTKVVFKNPEGQVEEQFTVTTDAQKRIVKIVDMYESVGTYTYDSHGNVTRSEVIWNGLILDRSTYEYDLSSTAKSPTSMIKGHPFAPAYLTPDIIYYPPLNGGGRERWNVKSKYETQWNEDFTGLVGTLRTYVDITSTLKTNSNNFVTEVSNYDAVSKQTYVHKYTYSNCN